MFRRKLVASQCGHRTKREGQVSAFDQTTHTEMPKNASGGVDWCLGCISEMAIRCAWCGNTIFIGDPVTLYTPSEGIVPNDWAVIYTDNPLRVVGCLGWNCADSGADRGGFWIPGEDGKGMVFRVSSPLELAMQGGAVFFEDLSAINEALSPKVIDLED